MKKLGIIAGVDNERTVQNIKEINPMFEFYTWENIIELKECVIHRYPTIQHISDFLVLDKGFSHIFNVEDNRKELFKLYEEYMYAGKKDVRFLILTKDKRLEQSILSLNIPSVMDCKHIELLDKQSIYDEIKQKFLY